MVTRASLRIAAWMSAALLGAMGAAGAEELRVANAGDMLSALPAGSTEPATQTPVSHIYEGLLTWKESGEVAPMLAKTLPRVSDDGLSYVFDLREGITFHNGEPLDAAAVVQSWTFLLNAQNGWGCRRYFNGSGSVRIAKVEATGPLQVTFTLAAPAAEFMTQMARSDCMEAGIMAPAMTKPGGATDKPIGTGPFRLESFRPGRDITLARFENYRPREEPMDGYAGRKEALVDRVVFVTIPDPAASQAALIAGNVDVWPRIELRYLPQLEADRNIVVQSSPVPSIYTLPIRTERPLLDKPAFRRAMNYAINRAQMVAALTEGRATASSSFLPASSDVYRIVADTSFTYDPDRAKALLREAGYNGQVVRITTNKNYAIMFETGVLVQAFLQQVGINAEVETVDFATQLPRYGTGEYDLMTFNYAPTLDPALVLDRIAGSKATDRSKTWDDPRARELVTRLIATPAPERAPLYRELHEIYMAGPPMIVWATGEVTSAARRNVDGYRAWPGRIPRFWGVSVRR